MRSLGIRRCAAALALVAVLGVGQFATTSSSKGDPIADKQQQAEQIASKLDSLQQQVEDAANHYEAAKARIAELDHEIADQQVAVDQAKSKAAHDRETLGRFAVSQYVDGGANDGLVALVGSSKNKLAPRQGYREAATGNRQQLVDNLEASKKRAQAEVDQLAAARKEAEAQRATAADEKHRAEQGAAQYQQLNDQVQGELRQLVIAKQEAEQRAAEARAYAQAQAEAEAQARAQQAQAAQAQQAQAEQAQAQETQATQAQTQGSAQPSASSSTTSTSTPRRPSSPSTTTPSTTTRSTTSPSTTAPSTTSPPTTSPRRITPPTTAAPVRVPQPRYVAPPPPVYIPPPPVHHSSPPPAPSGGSQAAGAVQAAMSKLGSPYVWGASGPSTFDCSGLTMWAYRQVGISLPRVTYAQEGAGRVVPVSQIAVGDLVFYSGGGHVAMYIGGGQVVHAPHTGDVVKVSSLYMMPVELVVRVA